MNKLVWKTNEVMQVELNKRIAERKPEHGKDGHILAAEGKFIYRNIAYLIKVLRYFNHTDRFTMMMSNRISDCHVVVEYPDETKPIVQMVMNVDEYSEFLYYDTLHSWNDKQTVEQQIKECHELAKKDIDSLFDGAVKERIETQIKKFQDIMNKIETLK